MTHARAIARLFALIIGTAFLYLSVLLVRWFSHRAELGIRQIWGRMATRIVGATVEVTGVPPNGPCLLVSNHLSYLDIPIYWTQVRGAFLSRADVASWPIIGVLARAAGTLFIDRARKRDIPQALDGIRRTIARGDCVVVFPEGTSSDGSSVLPFRSSFLEAAADGDVSVVPAAIHYFTPPEAAPAATSVCWWGDMEFIPHFYALLLLPSIRAQIIFGDTPLVAQNRKLLASRAHQAVIELHTPEESCSPQEISC